MAPFYEWNCLTATTTTRRQFTFYHQALGSPGTQLINLRRMKCWVNLGATLWFWTRDQMGGSKDDSAFHHRSFNYSLWLTIMISWSAHVWITRTYNLFFSCVITIKKCGRMILKHFEKDSSYLYHTKPQNIWDFRNDFPLHTT